MSIEDGCHRKADALSFAAPASPRVIYIRPAPDGKVLRISTSASYTAMPSSDVPSETKAIPMAVRQKVYSFSPDFTEPRPHDFDRALME
jgi:hypothetical protein